MTYDIIGDIHGHADALESLLTKLGYERRHSAWRHPEHQVIFLGDFIDRGPKQLETLQIAREMIEAGSALAVMGNHEFNAIAWATPHPRNPSNTIREHTDKNRHQHRAFLDAVGENSRLHTEWVAWFRSLPLWIETSDFRVVHAAWLPDQIAELAPYLGNGTTLSNALLSQYAEKAGVHDATEMILKGVEAELPKGSSFTDKDGHPRTAIRIKWWEQDAKSYGDAALELPTDGADWSSLSLPSGLVSSDPSNTPVFVGHYWLTGSPRLMSPKLACLDFSVAKGGVLCAYRWRGEKVLSEQGLIWV